MAAESKILTTSGSFDRAANWSPPGRPRLGDSLVIPPGKKAELKGSSASGDLLVEGNMAGSGLLETNGSLTLVSKVDWVGSLRVVGFCYLTSGGNRIAHIYSPTGAIKLLDDLHAGSLEYTSSFNTKGHDVTIDGLDYPLEQSYSDYEDSTMTLGAWIVYPFELFPDKWTFQYSDDAAFIITGAASEFRGGGWEYGKVIWHSSESLVSGNGYTVEELWEINTPAVTFERGQTITLNGSLVLGPGPHTLSSSQPGEPWTLLLPGDTEITAEVGISDLTVTGGTLTVHGGTDEGGNSGVVFVG